MGEDDNSTPGASATILELPPPPLPPPRVLRRAFERVVLAAGANNPNHPQTRIYVLMHGAGRREQLHDPESRSCTPLLLDELRRLFAAAASAGAATADVVPVLPFAHEGDGAVGFFPDARYVLSLRGNDAARELADKRGGGESVEVLEFSPPPPPITAADGPQTTPPAPSPTNQTITFPDVAVGGTFDRLHAGHRLLLAVTALVATQRVFVGVTADALLQSKKQRELLQPYDERAQGAAAYMRRVRPGLVEIKTGALRDPNEPTQAELDPAMRALVVSKETIKGGEAINDGRLKRGFSPLGLVVVGLVGDGGGDGGEEADVADKLSSTALREREAGRRGGGGGE